MPKKYAVIFGTNYTVNSTINQLNGCVADAEFWRQYATQKNFDEVHVYLNDQCSKAAMVQVLNEVLAKAQPDDLVVDCYSGHGSIIPPGSQTLIPNDFSWSDSSTWLCYDELDRIFLPHEMRGVKIVVVHDSCHSQASNRFRDFSQFPTKNRFLEPPPHIMERIVANPFDRNLLTSQNAVLLLSGCLKSQTSADAYIDGAYHGAFTYSVSLALKNNPSINYFDAILQARAWLAMSGYNQTPGADGDEIFRSRAFFE